MVSVFVVGVNVSRFDLEEREGWDFAGMDGDEREVGDRREERDERGMWRYGYDSWRGWAGRCGWDVCGGGERGEGSWKGGLLLLLGGSLPRTFSPSFA